jgi:hypothetical protein
MFNVQKKLKVRRKEGSSVANANMENHHGTASQDHSGNNQVARENAH